ncbi:DUF6301 family protein [Nocardia sp. NPDC050712]|uniref:DUF6301 family protein n=1 Tax=Nocardia sp. NPDC050712 TaxID=3155518 RepID=UPI0033C713B0
MQVDSDKIASKVGVAASFAWTWSDSDLAAFCEAQGWRVKERDRRGAVLATDLELDRPEARWSSKDGTVERVSVWVVDEPAKDTVDAVRRTYDGFVDITSAIERILGPATRRRSGADGEVRWDLAHVVVRLRLFENSIYFELVNPEHQAWIDAPDDEDS